MLKLRRSNDRGQANYGWLSTHYSFSFSNYLDPDFMGFRSLRVMNEDIIDEAMGFQTHPHRNMEIISFIIEGEIEHKDSMGNHGIIGTDEIQIISAGSGITHSEFNPSKINKTKIIQVWIEANQKNTPPLYTYKKFNSELKNEIINIVSSENIKQDAFISYLNLDSTKSLTQEINNKRYYWIQLIKGHVKVNGTTLEKGDGLAIELESTLNFEGISDSRLLLFDLN
jgi:redox-sensitive bicupin YhaK (pirin superfamily)